MIRKLLATTAIATLVASGAYAQTQTEQSGAAGQQEMEAQQTEQGQEAQQQDQTAQQATQPAGDQMAGQQAQQEITVSDGATVIIEAQQEEVQVNLRIQRGQAGMQQQGQVQPDQQQAQTGQAQQDQQQAAQQDQQAQQQGDQEMAGVRARDDLQAADIGQISADDLIGSEVYSANDENIGSINDVLLTQEGQVDAIVVDVGGFLGMGAQEVALGMDELELMSDADGNWYVYTPYTQEQLEGAPQYDQATWEDQRDQQRWTPELAQQQPQQDQATDQQAAQTEQPADQQQAQTGAATQDGQQQAQMQAGQAGHNVVADGGTVIVLAERENFQLNFEVRMAGDQVAQTGQQQPGQQMQQDQDTTAAIGRDQMQGVEAQQVRADDLIGSTVYGMNDENVGNVGDIILTEQGSFDAVIVDVGGFLGIGTREVALGLDEVQFMRDENNNWFIYTQYTRDQIEAAPEYDEATYAEHRDQQRIGIQQQ